ncbi:unnamed protein product, partial [Prorocentrum cordatum]
EADIGLAETPEHSPAEAEVLDRPLGPQAPPSAIHEGSAADEAVELASEGGVATTADAAGATRAEGAAALRLRLTLVRALLRSQLQRAAEAAEEAYGRALALARAGLREDRWGCARLCADRAVVRRRLGDLAGALADADEALSTFPRYARALFRRGLVLLELGRPRDAVRAFEGVLRLDRRWPQLCHWLARARAESRRADVARGAARGAAEDEAGENYYGLLGVSADFTLDELKHAFRRASLTYHPDKPGGSERAFRRVAAAYETLADQERRKSYDQGRDLSDSFFQEIEREYFPERYGFWPFGDPYEDKRRFMSLRRGQTSQRGAQEQAWDL